MLCKRIKIILKPQYLWTLNCSVSVLHVQICMDFNYRLDITDNVVLVLQKYGKTTLGFAVVFRSVFSVSAS